MSDKRNKLPPISDWDALFLRMTAYPVNPRAIDAQLEDQWWQSLTGSEPESVTRKKLESQYEGSYENHGLQLTITPLVVQWVRLPKIDPQDPPDGLPKLGALPDASDSFSTMIQKWLAESPPLKRLAFGTVLIQPVESHASGYGRLNDYLPFVDLDPDASDFNFKINRPRPSDCGIGNLEINRLTSWSLLRWEMGIAQHGQESTQWTPSQGFACRLELDINSSHEVAGEPVEKLPQEQLIPLWQELVELGVEIAAGGDMP